MPTTIDFVESQNVKCLLNKNIVYVKKLLRNMAITNPMKFSESVITNQMRHTEKSEQRIHNGP